MARDKIELRKRRKARIRKTISGTEARPRLTVFRSLTHVYAQVVDDLNNRVLVSAGSAGKTAKGELAGLNKSEQAKKIGQKIAESCKDKGIEKVVFDRNGYRYHGRVLALASAARENGLQF